MHDTPPLPRQIRTRADVDALLAATTNYEERLPRDPLRQALDLGRVQALFAAVGHPQVGPRTAHVAGSKGKGTVARMIAAGLRQDRRGPVGLYTSPHLEDLSERIAIDGVPVGSAALARAAAKVLPHVAALRGTPEAPTFFELFTAIAWLVFQEAGCSDVVLETGLGGRLDATNVCVPAVTVITTIELEHTRLLGDSVEAIAAEKAGILKPGVPVIAVGLDPAPLAVVRARAVELGAPLDEGGTLDIPVLPLPGPHHVGNARAAYLALRALDVGAATAWEGIARVELPGILEQVALKPRVIIDGAHTVRSARGTRDAVAARWPGEPVVLLVALLEEKDVVGVVSELARNVEHVVTTEVDSPRCLRAVELADQLRGNLEAPVTAEPNVQDALGLAATLAGAAGLVLCAGSMYLAGDVRSRLRLKG